MINFEWFALHANVVPVHPTAADGTGSNGSAIDLQPYMGALLFMLDSAAGTSDSLTTNGGFGADTDWTKGTGWTIGAGKADCDGTQVAASELKQNQACTQGLGYTVTYTLSSVSAGSITPKLGGTAGTARTANGTYTEVIVCGAGVDPKLVLSADADFVGKVDDVSVIAASLALKIQHSTDGSTSWADVTGGAFATVYGIASQQILSLVRGKGLRRYIRLVDAYTGANVSFIYSVNMAAVHQYLGV
jgi:hypothetical protein